MRFKVMAEQPSHRQAPRSPLRAALALVVSFGLAACALVPAPQVQSPPVASASPPPEPVRAAPAPEPGPQPVPGPGLPRDEGRNRIAVLVPLTGPNAAVGQSLANAATLALLDTGGQAIRLTVYDTAKGAAGAAAQALADGNRLFLGPLLADDVRAVAPVARRAGVPVIAFSNDAGVAGPGIYLVGFAPAQSVARVVGYARGQGLTRFAALTPSGIYGRRVGQAMIDTTQRSGARLVGIQEYDRDAAGLLAAVTRVSAQGAYDAILIADPARSAAAAVPAVRAAVPRAHILGTELWANEAAIGAVPGLRGAWFAAVPDTLFNQMRTRYRARYGTAPYRLASLAYDTVLLAVRTSRDWRPGEPYPQRALHDPAGFTGIDGPYRFSANGIAERSLEVREVTIQGSTIVSPARGDAD
jgi:ABC-type branched-subunit amino acid transport system substrate-binding protein